MASSALSRELVFLIMQFLYEENLREAAHMLEQESGFFFNLDYFEEMSMKGEFDKADKYLSAFTRIDDNRYAVKIFFELRKQKYYEALDTDRSKALDILVKDLSPISSYNADLFKDLTQLLTLDDFRENSLLTHYTNATAGRAAMFNEIQSLIVLNPLLRDKLQFPDVRQQRLRMLINQSLNWQHSLCQNPRRNPDMSTLFVDHSCRNASQPYALQSANNPMIGSTSRSEGLILGTTNGALTPIQTSMTTWMLNPGTALRPTLFTMPIGVGNVSNKAAAMQAPGCSNDITGGRPKEIPHRLSMAGTSFSQSLTIDPTDELPKAVARTLNQGSAPVSMDFHPIQQTFLLVGTEVGDISMWEVGSRQKFLTRNFFIWNVDGCSVMLKAALVQDPSVSVTRVLWSPDGSSFGVAYSKHLVQIFTYSGGNDIKQHLEIDAHLGAVNDLAFCSPAGKLNVITCGDDKTIKIWEVATGVKLHTYEGHEAPVFSLYPHIKEHVPFFFSTSLDGRIKAWLYDDMGCRIDYHVPAQAWTKISYSSDGKRLFSCGTNISGEAHLVEWNENDGIVKRTYQGYTKSSSGSVQFDTMKNRFLAVGDDFSVKFWDMDDPNLLISIDAEGGLPTSPCIRFNKEGTLLAVSANDNKIKILANIDGLRLMRTCENQYLVNLRIAAEIIPERGQRTKREVMTSSIPQETNLSMIWKHCEITQPTQLQSIMLPTHVNADKITRLVFTNSGKGILALALNAIHLFWKWSRNDGSRSGKATTKDAPYLFQAASGIVMINDLSGVKIGEGLPCFALAKNDSYLISSSGGKVSLFNLATLKTMFTCLVPPPAATCLAFYPEDNNIIAIGLEDSSIRICNIRNEEVKIRLQGHFKRITGLAFSQKLNILVSAGADDQIIVWNCERWEKEKNVFLQISGDRIPITLSDSGTLVEFHRDQTHILAVHETQLSIYEARGLECVKQWFVGETSALISHATFSCAGDLIYASFQDGSISIHTPATLEIQCRINPAAYLPSDIVFKVWPLVLAAHPLEPYQFAAGLSDGKVYLFEPLESEGKWMPPPSMNRVAQSIPSTSQVPLGSNQLQA